LELLKTYLYFDVFEQTFLTDGTTNLLVDRLNEETTTMQFGINTIQVLYTVAYKSK